MEASTLQRKIRYLQGSILLANVGLSRERQPLLDAILGGVWSHAKTNGAILESKHIGGRFLLSRAGRQPTGRTMVTDIGCAQFDPGDDVPPAGHYQTCGNDDTQVLDIPMQAMEFPMTSTDDLSGFTGASAIRTGHVASEWYRWSLIAPISDGMIVDLQREKPRGEYIRDAIRQALIHNNLFR